MSKKTTVGDEAIFNSSAFPKLNEQPKQCGIRFNLLPQ
jgi:hypothetical protein